MRTAQPSGITTAFLVALTAAACTNATRSTAQPPAPGGQGGLAAIAQARADSARLPYTAADVRFMSSMIGHHAQAIVMSRWAPTHGASPSLRTLASRIINAQQDEIVTMQRWLRDRRKPVPEGTAAGVAIVVGGMGDVMVVLGRLTETQMNQLDAGRGPE